MEIRLRYFEGCPHWQTMFERLREALTSLEMADVEPVLERVETWQEAERLGFVGSVTSIVVLRSRGHVSQRSDGGCLLCHQGGAPSWQGSRPRRGKDGERRRAVLSRTRQIGPPTCDFGSWAPRDSNPEPAD